MVTNIVGEVNKTDMGLVLLLESPLRESGTTEGLISNVLGGFATDNMV